MRALFAATALAVLSACATNVNFETDDSYRVVVSEGGDNFTWSARLNRLNREGKRVIIADNARCRSACTMLLAADDICVGANAVFGFHGSTAYAGDPRGDEYWTDFVASHYPPKLRAWFYGAAAHLRLSWVDLTGSQVSQLTGIPICSPS